jgi:ubiquinone/menaquinone biosynthesis C-methylase UbiE
VNKQKFDEFFKVHSQNVDNADSLGFWKLADEVLEHFLLEEMPNRDNVTVVDFGGGTGRWLKRLDQYFTNSEFIIVDLSEDMLAQAKQKIDAGVYNNDIRTITSDISAVSALTDGAADYIISTYNPLSFVEKPQLVIQEANRILKANGKAMITIQGYYNALFSKVNNYLADAEELKTIFDDKKVLWNSAVPALWQLPQEDMEGMFTNASFKDIHSRGIACIAQPQAEDFDPENKSFGALSTKLNTDAAFFEQLLQIEIAAGKNQGSVNRGMNILTIGTKR